MSSKTFLFADMYGSRPEDRYYPSYYSQNLPRDWPSHSRANIDPYATLTPSERLRSHYVDEGMLLVYYNLIKSLNFAFIFW